jgi:hypothetical protein
MCVLAQYCPILGSEIHYSAGVSVAPSRQAIRGLDEAQFLANAMESVLSSQRDSVDVGLVVGPSVQHECEVQSSIALGQDYNGRPMICATNIDKAACHLLRYKHSINHCSHYTGSQGCIIHAGRSDALYLHLEAVARFTILALEGRVRMIRGRTAVHECTMECIADYETVP